MRKQLKMRWAGAAALAACLGGVAALPAASPSAAKPAATAKLLVPRPLAEVVTTRLAGSIKTSQCLAKLGIACYSPIQLERAYGMPSLYRKGLTGSGETIALVDSFGSPTIANDLQVFDQTYGLPAPPSFSIIQPAGKVRPYNPKNALMVSWAEETSLDVEYSHAMAPGANILLVETPVAETIGVQGFKQIVRAENYVINHNMASVISQSLATAEASFPSPSDLLALRSSFVNAAAHNVSVLGAAGDWGETSPSDASESTYYTKPTANWPASDPLVTAVGGTQLFLNNAGKRISADIVWNDGNLLGGPIAGGGGLSTVFTRPTYQDGVESVVHDARGIPDISMSAAVNGGALVYMSFAGLPGPGFYIIGGTSEATPLFSGVVAVADQAAGHWLGLLNPALYTLAATHAPGIVDITTGNNAVSFIQNGKTYNIRGAVAVPGYDLASGVGTVNAAKLVPELAAG
jgi:subtilase family serine protease